MTALKGQCSIACKGNKRDCWHKDCTLLRRLKSGKFLIENEHGYIRAAVPADLFFSISEERNYNQYNLKANEWTLQIEVEEAEKKASYQTMMNKLRNSFRVQLN